MEIKSLDERIQGLIRTIEHDAQTDIDAIKAQTAQKEAEVLSEGEQQARSLRESIIGKAQQGALKRKEELKAEHMLSLKKAFLDQREVQLQKVFNEVKMHLEQILHTTEYQEALPGLVREALVSLETPEAIIHLDAYSRKLISVADIKALSEELQMQITMGDDLTVRYGVIATDKDAKRQFENTLQSRLNRKKKFLRSDVFRILMGEEK